MAEFTALIEHGTSYVVDPSSAYAELSENPLAIDNVQFPRQTLSFRAGEFFQARGRAVVIVATMRWLKVLAISTTQTTLLFWPPDLSCQALPAYSHSHPVM